ncbi:MAG TPA: hypothetical protein ENI87_00655 [bacterium]|nr:hypothetical protein [bacterium]
MPRVLFALTFLTSLLPAQELPRRLLKADDTVIKESCRLVIDGDRAIEDLRGDGVVQIEGSGITVEFEQGQVLRGAEPTVPPNQMRGIGIVVRGQHDVRLRGFVLRGFKVGVLAEDAPGLVIEGLRLADLYRQRLGSTVSQEDSGDWLSPHRNDQREWMEHYGAGIYVARSSRVTVRGCHARDGQNGLVLDRVEGSRVYDNDFSFLSGWGLAMWRSSDNVISRNAFDFCVRGYSHGVYNRGQDSAGILMFEQCCRNLVIENSATHGGDGFFGFGGREALGEAKAPEGFDHRRRGNNDNVLVGNDFSDAVAHGIEMTFSFGNVFANNDLSRCAICGVWGGYSRDTLITRNSFRACGDMAYGLERGGVNIEHGQDNLIVENTFRDNACAIHLWWDADERLASLPWSKANGHDMSGNVIARNDIRGGATGIQLRDSGTATLVRDNVFTEVRDPIVLSGGSRTKASAMPRIPSWQMGKPLGETRPVGARPHLRGRDKIVMTQWGPWPHEGGLVRLESSRPSGHRWEVRLPEGSELLLEGSDGMHWQQLDATHWEATAESPGVHRYAIAHTGGRAQRGVLVRTDWAVRIFPFPHDPRTETTLWEQAAARAPEFSLPGLSLAFGNKGPSELGIDPQLTAANIGGDHFGIRAHCRLPLAKGSWRIRTLSDDGVRVQVDDQPIIDNWTWHGPTRDEGSFRLNEAKTVDILVDYFELDGHAVLEFEIRPEA